MLNESYDEKFQRMKDRAAEESEPATESRQMNPVPCFICGKQMPAICDSHTNQPSGGTAFEARGHYGSGVFDPMDLTGEKTIVELAVCDDCFRPRKVYTRVVSQTTKTIRMAIPQYWWE
jgi:hypothetical protein